MTIWIVYQKTDFTDTKYEEVLYNVAMGFVHIFCFLNMQHSPTRYRLAIFYTVTYVENAILIALWYKEPESQTRIYAVPALVVILLGFFVGPYFMCFYYRFFHPTGIIPYSLSKERNSEEPGTSDKRKDHSASQRNERDRTPRDDTPSDTTNGSNGVDYLHNFFSSDDYRQNLHSSLLSTPQGADWKTTWV